MAKEKKIEEPAGNSGKHRIKQSFDSAGQGQQTPETNLDSAKNSNEKDTADVDNRPSNISTFPSAENKHVSAGINENTICPGEPLFGERSSLSERSSTETSDSTSLPNARRGKRSLLKNSEVKNASKLNEKNEKGDRHDAFDTRRTTLNQQKSRIPIPDRDTKAAAERSSEKEYSSDGEIICSKEKGSTLPLGSKQTIRRAGSTHSIQSNSTERSSATICRNGSAAELSSGDNIKVVIRVRPLAEFEKRKGDKHVVENPEKGVIWVNTSHGHTKPFSFTTVCGEGTTQEEVFNTCGIKELIRKALEGFSCTAFAFGHTGSGKTYTITGPVSQDLEKPLPREALQGLLPRSFKFLFDELARDDHVYIVRASFLEVYNEKVQDLLNPSKYHDSLPVRYSSKFGFHVENLFTVECENLADLMNILNEGLRYRQMGCHALNEHSSRSHSMLTIYIDSEMNDPDEDFPIVKHGKISFVDLAGSERVKETKVSGGALTESQNINKSLLTLGNCIAALGDPKKRGGHIPYRDSKLTKLLADSLGGDGFTLMIACIAPAADVVQDTLNTLRYANRAKNIKNKPVVKMDPREQLIMRLKKDIKVLKSENAYFREQMGVTSSESQLAVSAIPVEATGDSNALSGAIISATGVNSLPSLSSNNNKETDKLAITVKEGDDNRATTAMYAMSASFGLYDMLQGYMNENEALRTENLELHQSRAIIQREHEMLSRENEKLASKLEELERVFASSPLPSLSRNNSIASIPSAERVSPWTVIRQRYLNRSQEKSKESLMPRDSSIEDLRVILPPVRKGNYPNYTAHDLAEDLAIEHRKLKQERARKEKETESQSHTLVDKDAKGNLSRVGNGFVAEENADSSSPGEIDISLIESDGALSNSNSVELKSSSDGDAGHAQYRRGYRQEVSSDAKVHGKPINKIRRQHYVSKEKKKMGYAALFASKKDTSKAPGKATYLPGHNGQLTSSAAAKPPPRHSLHNEYLHSQENYHQYTNGYAAVSGSLPSDLRDLEGQIQNEFHWNQFQKF